MRLSLSGMQGIRTAVTRGASGHKVIAGMCKRCCLTKEEIDLVYGKMEEGAVSKMYYPQPPIARYGDYEMMMFKELERIWMGKHKLVIWGCGGHARSVADVVHQYGFDIEIIMVDENAHKGETILGHKAVKSYEMCSNDSCIIAVGDNAARKIIFQEKKAERCITVVSRDSYIGSGVKIGVGVFVAPFAYIGPQAVIGENTIINSGSIVEHETVIGSHTHIAPNAVVCGRAKIGDNVFCGAGSTIIDKIRICSDVTIGAGAVVKEDIIEAGTYVGVPAKKVG